MTSKRDWILLSTAVARMAELHPDYLWYPGQARRDLERIILAGRLKLRGDGWNDKEVPISETITARHALDLIHDTLSIRRPGPPPLNREVLFRNVKIDWIKAAEYLREFVVSSSITSGPVATANNPGTDEGKKVALSNPADHQKADRSAHSPAHVARVSSGDSGGIQAAAAKTPANAKARRKPGPTPGSIARFEKSDKAIISKMTKLMRKEHLSPTQAAFKLVDKIPGHGTDQSKVRRVVRLYNRPNK